MRFKLSNITLQIAFAHSPFRYPDQEVKDKKTGEVKIVKGREHRRRSTTAQVSLLIPADVAEARGFFMKYAVAGKNGKVFKADGVDVVQIVLATATSYTSPRDQFCRKIGRRAAVGKAISALISGAIDKDGSIKATLGEFVTDGNDTGINAQTAKELFKQL